MSYSFDLESAHDELIRDTQLAARLFGRFALARSVLPVAEPGTEWRRYTVTYPNGYSFCYAWETVCLVWHSLLVNGWQPHEITVTMGWK